MAFDNFETVNDTLLADFDGAGLYSAIVGGIDRGLEWGVNGAAGGALLLGTAGFITGAIDNY